MSKEGKHHYIPKFYLQHWAGTDGRLWQFSRPYARVKPKRVYPDETGFVHGLNTVPDLAPGDAQYVETEFLQKVDDKASRALRAMVEEPQRSEKMPIELSVGWASFLYSLIVRSPEVLARMQVQFDAERARLVACRNDGDANRTETGTPLPRASIKAVEILPTLLSSKLVIRGIVEMRWAVKSTMTATYPMLTSDRPTIMTNGLSEPTSHIAIPLSPTFLFFATRSEQTFRMINSMTPDQTVLAVNSKVSEQAITFVYGIDDKQLRFVANRLGRRVQSTPFG